jgi:hypothetical protein
VAPVGLPSRRRVARLLGVYFVVALVQALVERAGRRQRRVRGLRRLTRYAEARARGAPAAALVCGALAGPRRQRLVNGPEQLLGPFHAERAAPAQRVLELLGVEGAAYGLA